jgi:hypothetical protein
MQCATTAMEALVRAVPGLVLLYRYLLVLITSLEGALVLSEIQRTVVATKMKSRRSRSRDRARDSGVIHCCCHRCSSS